MRHHIKHTLSFNYHNDAIEFIRRYEMLRPEDFSKSGRVKNFVDVILAAECILKAHIFLGRSSDDALALYKKVRKLGHKIGHLAERADYLDDRAPYVAEANRFESLSVNLRYSLDMWETYFPDDDNTDQIARYDRTVADTAWQSDALNEVKYLIEQLTPALTGPVNCGIDELFNQGLEMAKFVKEAGVLR